MPRGPARPGGPGGAGGPGVPGGGPARPEGEARRALREAREDVVDAIDEAGAGVVRGGIDYIKSPINSTKRKIITALLAGGIALAVFGDKVVDAVSGLSNSISDAVSGSADDNTGYERNDKGQLLDEDGDPIPGTENL